MLNEEAKYKQKQKRKKILIIAILAVIGLFVVIGIVTLILSAVKNHNDDVKRAALDKQGSYNFVEPDYNLNIFDDKDYMQTDRSIHVSDGNAVTVITDKNQTDYPPEILFMRDVINYIINGDYTNYNKIFTDDYLKNAGDNLRETFTMQQLFNIQLQILSSAQSGNTTTSAVEVSYEIRNNNGTFRNDFDAGYSRPVVYKLTRTTDPASNTSVIKVTDILTLNQYSSGLY